VCSFPTRGRPGKKEKRYEFQGLRKVDRGSLGRSEQGEKKELLFNKKLVQNKRAVNA